METTPKQEYAPEGLPPGRSEERNAAIQAYYRQLDEQRKLEDQLAQAKSEQADTEAQVITPKPGDANYVGSVAPVYTSQPANVPGGIIAVKSEAPAMPVNAAGQPGPWEKPATIDVNTIAMPQAPVMPRPTSQGAGGPEGYFGQLDRTARELQRTNEETKSALGKTVALEQEKNNTLATLSAQQAAVDDQMAYFEAQRKAKQAQALQAQQAKIAGLDSIANNTMVDPNHLLGKGITANRVMAAIATGLGEYVRSVNGKGGPNIAAEAIDRAISNDVEEQRQLLISRKGKAEGARSQFAALKDQFGDDDQASLATRIVAMQAAQRKLAEVASQYDNPAIQARAQATMAEMDKQTALLKQELADRGMGKFAASMAGVKAPLTVEGLGGVAKSDTAQKEAEAFRSLLLESRGAVADLKTFMQKNPGLAAPNSKTSETGNFKINVIRNLLREWLRMKQATADEQAQLRSMLSDPTRLRADIASGQLDEFLSLAERNAAAEFQGRGMYELNRPTPSAPR